MQGTPHDVEGVPPEREESDGEEREDTNPERQGPDPGPTDAPTEEGDQGQSGPPPESIPGDEGTTPNPKQG